MRLVSAAAAFLAGCSVLAERGAQKLPGTHYSAAFIKDSTLFVFPFDGKEMTINLPANLRAMKFSADGQTLFGVATSTAESRTGLVAASFKPSILTPFPGSSGFSSILDLAVNVATAKAIISATYRQKCGLFELDQESANVEHIVGNVGGRCNFLSSWSHLSVSPDGSRAVGTATKGRIGLINLKDHRIERVWSGANASWSPDGKWTASLTFTTPMKIELFSALDF